MSGLEPVTGTSELAAGPPAAAPPLLASSPSPAHGLGWRALKNSVAIGVGSNVVALCRLVLLGLIVRSCGVSAFAYYVLLVEIMKIAEGIVDFGATEVFVREISHRSAQRDWLLRVLTAAKLVQAPVGIVMVLIILLVMQYPAELVQAGMVGSAGLLFYAGILIYRVIFRVNLTMEREIAAELVSVLAMIGLVVVLGQGGIPLLVLMLMHLASRALFCSLCVLFGSRGFLPSLRGVGRADIGWGLRSSLFIGLAGFFVGIYQSVEVLLISRLITPDSPTQDLAYYSAAQKLSWPMLMALAGIGATLYSVAAASWPHARETFDRACQRGVEVTLLAGGLAACLLIAGNRFFMRLLGPELVGGSAALQVLAVLCVVKAFSMTLGPTLFVARKDRLVLGLISVALLVKIALIIVLAPHLGFLGVAFIALGVELFFIALPSIYLVRRHTGFRVRWREPLKVILAGVIAVVATKWAFEAGTPVAAIAAGTLYLVIVVLSGAVRLSELRLRPGSAAARAEDSPG